METWCLLLLLLPFPLGIADEDKKVDTKADHVGTLSHEEMCSNNQLDQGSIDMLIGHQKEINVHGHAHGQDTHGQDGHAHQQDSHGQDDHALGQDSHEQDIHAHGQDIHAHEQDGHAHGHGVHNQGHHVLGSSLDTESQDDTDEYYYIENPHTSTVLDVSDEGEVIMANKASTRLTQQWRNESGILVNKQTGLALHVQQQSLTLTTLPTVGLSTWIFYKNVIVNIQTDHQARLLETDGLTVSLTFNHPSGTTNQKWAVSPVTGPQFMVAVPTALGQRKGKKCPELFENGEDIKEFQSFENHIDLPECWEDIKPEFKLFTKTKNCIIAKAKTELLDLKSCLALDELKAMEGLRKIVFITHGFMHNADTLAHGEWIEDMANEIIDHDEDVAVITVNWKEGAALDLVGLIYDQAAANTRYVGIATARIVDQLRKLKPKTRFHCIGHSLGAHICGFLGKETAIDRISGLDPAGPLFSGSKEEERLHSRDATVVDALHTDGDTCGMMRPIGDVDFYAGRDEEHYGADQKGCDYYITMIGSVCDHSRSVEIYKATIANRSCTPEVECSDYQKEGPIYKFPYIGPLWNATLTKCQDSNKQPRIGYWYQGGFEGLYGFIPKKDHPYC